MMKKIDRILTAAGLGLCRGLLVCLAKAMVLTFGAPKPAYAFFNRRMSEDAVVYPLSLLDTTPGEPFGPYDVGATVAHTAWVQMRDFDRVFAFVVIGTTFNASDELDTCNLQQATSSSGAGAKDLTTSPGDASCPRLAGDIAIIEARGEDLDVNAGYKYVRLTVGASDNTGTDEVCGYMTVHAGENAKQHQQGAPSVNLLYIDPSTPAGS